MDPIDEIARARAAELVDEDGHAIALGVHPPLPAAEIDEIEARLGVALPRELRDLLGYAAGLDGVLESVDFSGRALGFEAGEIFPAGVAIAHDGFGNHWVADVTPADRDVVPVWFACHDAPVILHQGPSIGHFLHELFRMCAPPHESLVDDVHEDRLFCVSRENPGVVGQPEAANGSDAVLAEFAATLDERFLLVDLRAAPIGMGFSWGRFGPRTEVRRHGWERVFAYRRPDRRRGLLRRRPG